MKEFIEEYEFCYDHSQDEEDFVICGFFKYVPSTHFQRLTLGRDDDESTWKFVDRITRVALDSVKECHVRVYRKSPAHEELSDYDDHKDEIKDLMIFETKEKDELKYFAFCGKIFNEFLAEFGAGAKLGKL